MSEVKEEVLLLHFKDGLTVKEIAEKLGLSDIIVKKFIAAAYVAAGSSNLPTTVDVTNTFAQNANDVLNLTADKPEEIAKDLNKAKAIAKGILGTLESHAKNLDVWIKKNPMSVTASEIKSTLDSLAIARDMIKELSGLPTMKMSMVDLVRLKQMDRLAAPPEKKKAFSVGDSAPGDLEIDENP